MQFGVQAGRSPALAAARVGGSRGRPGASTVPRRAARRAAARGGRPRRSAVRTRRRRRGRPHRGGWPAAARMGGADVGVDAVGEAAPALGAGLAAAQRSVDAAVDELLDGCRAVGVLFGAGDAGVATSTSWAARNTAISAISWGCSASKGRAQAGTVPGCHWRAAARIWSARSPTSWSARSGRGPSGGRSARRGWRQPAQRTDPLGAPTLAVWAAAS